jgi:hypothetical protein
MLLTLITSLALAQPAAAAPSAESIAAEVMQALGGEAAWNETRFLRFTFAGRRTHHWDKQTGRHRLEGQSQDGKRYVVLHDLDTRQGEAWLDGAQLSGEEAAQWLERAYGAWINDTYWLLMPYKLRDPGVTLTYDRSEELEGRTYDVLHLSFAGVGLTPGDQYWAWISRDTRLMDRWAYRLQDYKPDQPPTVWDWRNWQRHGSILLAPLRVQVGGDRTLELTGLAVPATLPDSVFTSPDPLTP